MMDNDRSARIVDLYCELSSKCLDADNKGMEAEDVLDTLLAVAKVYAAVTYRVDLTAPEGDRNADGMLAAHLASVIRKCHPGKFA